MGDIELANITPEIREQAAEYLRGMNRVTRKEADNIRDGLWDETDMVQRFARAVETIRKPSEAATTISNLQAEVERLQGEVRRLDYNGIHTCSETCTKLPCVQRREIERLREALGEIAKFGDGRILNWGDALDAAQTARQALEAHHGQ